MLSGPCPLLSVPTPANAPGETRINCCCFLFFLPKTNYQMFAVKENTWTQEMLRRHSNTTQRRYRPSACKCSGSMAVPRNSRFHLLKPSLQHKGVSVLTDHRQDRTERQKTATKKDANVIILPIYPFCFLHFVVIFLFAWPFINFYSLTYTFFFPP